MGTATQIQDNLESALKPTQFARLRTLNLLGLTNWLDFITYLLSFAAAAAAEAQSEMPVLTPARCK